jgi:precorrin-2/cobalt-factor-2 C20-methyltransferase
MAREKIMSGTLYGIGVGPGDPELLTVKAWRLISTARIIAYLAANGSESTARRIAAPFIDPDAREIIIDMPMRVEREPAQQAYNKGASEIAAALSGGDDVVFLCEGDPFFYGSFMYVFERLATAFSTVVVPGVTSISAASASMAMPLCHREDVLKILPATLDEARLKAELSTADAAAIIKIGRHFSKVKRVLLALELTSSAIIIENATQDNERISPVSTVSSDTLPYFSTIILRRNGTMST